MMTEQELIEQVDRAQAGDRAALEVLLAHLRDDVYRLALRMQGPMDAEDLAQEILVKVVTHLSSWRRESSLRTWVMRIAGNHLLNARRGRMESVSLEMMKEMNAKMLAMDPASLPEVRDAALMAEEVRLACTQGGLLALDRELRLAFILSHVLELPSELAAAVVEVEPAAFRKRVQRARERLASFLETTCGLVNPEAPCRCQKQVRACAAAGMVNPEAPAYVGQRCRQPVRQFNWALHEVTDMEQRFRAVVQSHPEYAAPDTLVAKVRAMLDAGGYRFLQ